MTSTLAAPEKRPSTRHDGITQKENEVPDIPMPADPMPDLARNALKVADSIDLSPVVQRYMNQRKVSLERANQVSDEMKKFLVMCSLDDSKGHVLTGEVDEMWHTFITFTRRYEDFCNQVNDGKLIHHVPAEDLHNYFTADKPANTYENTLDRYAKLFGKQPDPSIWPAPRTLGSDRPQSPYACEGGSGGSTPAACGVPGNPGNSL